jgi:hypothetical protein
MRGTNLCKTNLYKFQNEGAAQSEINVKVRAFKYQTADQSFIPVSSILLRININNYK